MFDFRFKYSDGNLYRVEHVSKVIVHASGGAKEFSGDEILTAYIPLRTMSLYSSDGNVTISGDNLIVIDILKEKA